MPRFPVRGGVTQDNSRRNKAAGGSPAYTDVAGQSSRLISRSNSVRVVPDKLNALDAGYLVAGSTADQSVGMQAFLNAVGNANGAGVIPPGTFHMGSAKLTVPTCTRCDIEGASRGGAYAYQAGGQTILQWDTDTTGAPHTSFGLNMTACAAASIRGLAMISPAGGATVFNGPVGGLPCILGGLQVAGSARVEHMTFSGFSSAIGIGGPGVSADHSMFRDIFVSGAGYGFNLLPNPSTSGDLDFSELNVSTQCAAIAVASSNQLGGSRLGGGIYGPVAILRYDDGLAPGTNGTIIANTMAVSTEFSQHAVIWDELHADGAKFGQVVSNVFINAFAFAPGTYGWAWEKTFTVASSSGATVTLNDGAGFWFRQGMGVSGGGAPAGTVVTAVAGSWPWTTVTLTLSNTFTPSGSLLVGIPRIATIVSGVIQSNRVMGWLSGGGNVAYPLFAADVGVKFNTVDDGPAAFTRAQGTPLTKGGLTYGNFGNTFGGGAGTMLQSGSMVGGCSAGDLLEIYPGNQLYVRQATGRTRPLGVAMLAATNLGSVDLQVKGTQANVVTVRNRTAGSIAAGALLYVDAANVGGVTATVPTAGYIAPIGVNGTAAIAAGATGTIDQLFL